MKIERCNDETVQGIVTWLSDDSLKFCRVDIPTQNKTELIRKDLIMFIDIE